MFGPNLIRCEERSCGLAPYGRGGEGVWHGVARAGGMTWPNRRKGVWPSHNLAGGKQGSVIQPHGGKEHDPDHFSQIEGREPSTDLLGEAWSRPNPLTWREGGVG